MKSRGSIFALSSAAAALVGVIELAAGCIDGVTADCSDAAVCGPTVTDSGSSEAAVIVEASTDTGAKDAAPVGDAAGSDSNADADGG